MNDRRTSSPNSIVAELAMLRRRWLAPLLAALLLLQLAHLIFMTAAVIPVHMDVSNVESTVIDRALAAARGEVPYADWHRWPFTFTPYAPLTYYPVALASRLVDPAHHPRTIYLLGRMQSVLALFGTGWLLYRFARMIGFSPLWSLFNLACLTFWMPLITYCASYRPDAPASFFALLALFFVLRGPARPLPIAAALVSLFLSMWFKPVAQAMILLVAAWIAASMGIRRAAACIISLGLAGLIPLWLLDRHWHGLLLENIVFGSLQMGSSWSYPLYFIRQPGLPHLMIIAGLAASVSHLMRPAGRELRWLSAAALAAFAGNAMQSLKVGADLNYFMMSYPLLSLVAFHAAASLWKHPAPAFPCRTPPALREAALWLAVIPLLLWVQVSIFSNTRASYRAVARFWYPPQIETMLRGRPGAMLTQKTYFAVMNDSPPTIIDPFFFEVMVQRGRIDPAPLREKVRRREFATILLYRQESGGDSNIWSQAPSLQQIIAPELRASYAPAGEMAAYRLYLPLP